MPYCILVVDDELQVLAVFQRWLEDAGYAVMGLASGKDALVKIESEGFDLLVLDLSLPDVDGFDVLRAVRAKMPDLKVIATSGFMPETMLKIAGYLGTCGQLQKPVSRTALLEAVRGALA